jgi:peptide/nickel transport system substrate-binding protein
VNESDLASRILPIDEPLRQRLSEALGVPLSRRRMLGVMGLASVASLAAACGNGPSGTQTKLSDHFTIAYTDLSNETFDPTLGPAQNSTYLTFLFDNLVGIDAAGSQLSKATGVAKDWTISADSTVYTFQIRSGILFHNGVELTADDCKFSLDRLGGPKVVSTSGAAIFGMIAATTATDKYTLEVRLKRPVATFIEEYLSPLVDGGSSAVVPMAYYQSVGADGFQQNPIGSGPYKFVSHTQGASMTFERTSTKHHALGTPLFKTVTMRVASDVNSRFASLQTGGADYIDMSVSNFNQLKKVGKRGFSSHAVQVAFMMFQLQRPNEATRDINVRKALSYAINRAEINKFLLNGLGILDGRVWPRIPNPPQIPPDPYDVAMAQSFLNQTPYGQGGKKLTIELVIATRVGWDQMPAIGAAIQGYWQKIGVDAHLTVPDAASYRANWRAGTLPAPTAMLTAISSDRAQLHLATLIWSGKGAQKVVADPTLDAMISAWSVSTTVADYNTQQAAVSKYIHDNFITFNLVSQGPHYGGSASVPAKFTPGYYNAASNERGLVWDQNQ